MSVTLSLCRFELILSRIVIVHFLDSFCCIYLLNHNSFFVPQVLPYLIKALFFILLIGVPIPYLVGLGGPTFLYCGVGVSFLVMVVLSLPFLFVETGKKPETGVQKFAR